MLVEEAARVPACAVRAVARFRALAAAVSFVRFVVARTAAAAARRACSSEIVAVRVAQVSELVRSSCRLCQLSAFILISVICSGESHTFGKQAGHASRLMSSQVPSITKVIIPLDQLDSVAACKTKFVRAPCRKVICRAHISMPSPILASKLHVVIADLEAQFPFLVSPLMRGLLITRSLVPISWKHLRITSKVMPFSGRGFVACDAILTAYLPLGRATRFARHVYNVH